MSGDVNGLLVHALITGASSGIGAALARRLAAAGRDVTLVARRRDDLERLAAELPGRPFVRVADLSDPSCVEALVDDAVAARGPVDVLVNNAGLQYVEPAVGVDPARIELMIALNLTTPLRLVHRVLPGQIARGAGAIVNIASLGAVNPPPWMAHYVGTKAGLAAASESLGVEVARHGVHVVTVYPGPVATDMEIAARAAMPETWTTRILPTGTPEGLADEIHHALVRRRRRVVYPRVYAGGWWFSGVATTLVHALTPDVR